MRGASAAALEALSDELGTVLDGSTSASTLAGELFAFAGVLRDQPMLRRTLADASLPAEAKSGLAEELLSGKVDSGTRRLVGSAVERRWTTTADLPDTLERLSAMATIRSAGASQRRLGDELFAVVRLLHDHPELRNALADTTRSVEDRAGLVEGLLEGKVLAATLTLVKQALGGSHRNVGVALASYQELVAAAQQRLRATVLSARALSDAERDRLEAALGKLYGASIELHGVVDESLIGGMRVEVGDDVIDGTVLSRIGEARRLLAGRAG